VRLPRPLLVVCDLDGTILGASGSLSNRSAEAVRRLRASGVEVVFATGRPAWWLEPVSALLGDAGVVCLNGAVVHDPRDLRVLAHWSFPAHVPAEIVGKVRELDPSASFAWEWVGASEECGRIDSSMPERWGDADFATAPVSSMSSRPVAKIMVRSAADSDMLCRPLQDALGTAARVTRSQTPGTIELLDRRADKRHATEYVAQRLGVDREDTLAVGNGTNDLGLLLWAGMSAAPSNSVAQARRAARFLCGANTEDGVAGLFEALLTQA